MEVYILIIYKLKLIILKMKRLFDLKKKMVQIEALSRIIFIKGVS